MTPEFISLQCDHCGGALGLVPHQEEIRMTWGVLDPNDPMDEPYMFENHSQAYAAGRAAGWYIAEVELCPTCAESYAVEKVSEEEL